MEEPIGQRGELPQEFDEEIAALRECFRDFESVQEDYSRLLLQHARLLLTHPKTVLSFVIWKIRSRRLFIRIAEKRSQRILEFKRAALKQKMHMQKYYRDAPVLGRLYSLGGSKRSGFWDSIFFQEYVHAYWLTDWADDLVERLKMTEGSSDELAKDIGQSRIRIEPESPEFLPRREARRAEIIKILGALGRNEALYAKEIVDRLPQDLKVSPSTLSRHEMAKLIADGIVGRAANQGYYLIRTNQPG